MSIRPLKKFEQVTLDFEFDVSDEYIEQTIDVMGLRPSRRWAVTFDLADVPASIRGELRRAHSLYMHVDPYPMIHAPTEDAEEFLTAIAAWMEQAQTEQDEEVAEEDRLEKAAAVEQARFRLEMKEWVAKHGSARLRAAIQRDYKANTTYAVERAGTEMPGFWVDSAGDAGWGERSDPSEEALVLEDEVRGALDNEDRKLETRVVWLTEAPRALDRWLEEEDDEFEPQEAIVISDYLGRYVLVMPIDQELRHSGERS